MHDVESEFGPLVDPSPATPSGQHAVPIVGTPSTRNILAAATHPAAATTPVKVLTASNATFFVEELHVSEVKQPPSLIASCDQETVESSLTSIAGDASADGSPSKSNRPSKSSGARFTSSTISVLHRRRPQPPSSLLTSQQERSLKNSAAHVSPVLARGRGSSRADDEGETRSDSHSSPFLPTTDKGRIGTLKTQHLANELARNDARQRAERDAVVEDARAETEVV